MTSAIDPTHPISGTSPGPTTAAVRANFAAAKSEIETLQAKAGITDGSDPGPGEVGEYLYARLPVANALALVSGVTRDLLTLALPPGDWDVQGTVATSGTSTTVSDMVVWINEASRTQPDDLAQFRITEMNFGTGGQAGANARTQLMTGTTRMSSNQSVTVYLTTQITWGAGTVLVSGAIRARRMH
jgi:hypothetical protein